MPHTLVVFVKHANNLRDTDGIGAGKSDPYVKLRLVDNSGATVAGPKETSTKDDTLDPVWNEEVIFDNLEAPLSYTLKINVLDKDTLLGVDGGVADCLAADDKLGSAEVDLGELKKTDGFQDRELVVERRWLGSVKATLSISLSTKGTWGN